MLCFNPEYRMRKAIGSAFIYKIDPYTMSLSDQKIVHPINAIVLSLFNGKRSIDEISDLLAEVGIVNKVMADSFLANFIPDSGDLLVDNRVNDRYKPIDYIMPADETNMISFRLYSPLSLVLLITYMCTSDCIYCYANKNSTDDRIEMNLEFAKEIVDQAIDCDVQLIYLGGGDPFIKQWCIELVKYMIDKGITVGLSTKEYLPIRKCKELVDAGVRHIQLSIDTLDAKTAFAITGRPYFLTEIMETIDNLQKLNIEVTTNTVVMKNNLEQIPELLRFLLTMGIKHIILSRYYRSTFRHSDELFVTDNDIRWLLDQIDSLEGSRNVNIVRPRLLNGGIDNSSDMEIFLSRSSCAFGRIGLVVTPSGKVIPCEQLPTTAPFILGDLHQTTLKEVWMSKELMSLFRPDDGHFHNTPCRDCEYFEKCIYDHGLCIRDVYKVCGKLFGIHPHCPRSDYNVRLT
jgi:radical SAM protein with 4Fe4S-binding SPASM domain